MSNNVTMPQNPLLFLLRAAQIYPDKVALAHPDVKYPSSTLLQYGQYHRYDG